MGRSSFDIKRNSIPLADMASTAWRTYFLAACIIVAGIVPALTVRIMGLREDRSEDRGKIIYPVAILRGQLISIDEKIKKKSIFLR